MKDFASSGGKVAKMTATALGLAILAAPVAASFANAQDHSHSAHEHAAMGENDEMAPQAEAGETGATELTAEQVDASRETFNNFSCSACHTLSDAGASGQIGPSLDGSTSIDHEYIVNIVVNGQGAMPGFGGQIPDEEIDQLASYIMQVKQ